MTPLPPFMQPLERLDPEFVDRVAAIREDALYRPAHLPVKYAVLIAFALDVAHNQPTGVRMLSDRAREAGATEGEIADALKICYSVGGMQMLSAGTMALESH